MAIVNDRLNANKPQQSKDKALTNSVNNNKDLDVDIKKEEPTFFGSFFAKSKAPVKKGAAVMEAVSIITLHSMFRPPADVYDLTASTRYPPASAVE